MTFCSLVAEVFDGRNPNWLLVNQPGSVFVFLFFFFVILSTFPLPREFLSLTSVFYDTRIRRRGAAQMLILQLEALASTAGSVRLLNGTLG